MLVHTVDSFQDFFISFWKKRTDFPRQEVGLVAIFQNIFFLHFEWRDAYISTSEEFNFNITETKPAYPGLKFVFSSNFNNISF